ncbi:MAG: hypothetical protein RBR78_00100 [Flavobacteriaceae bacterium]|jgi:hypothetical protein|nr:hypothetical protein [Flavobacteriaceae bacterium]
MNDLIRTFLDYYNRHDFRKFQNNLAREVYESLGTSYSNSDGEVKIVTDMCSTIDGKTFEKLKFYTKKIHGTRSFVEFHNQDKPTTKELADMVIISVATKGREIIYEKTAFIQNKKEDTDSIWKIDQDQLYLLHNFPTFKGKKGIFKRNFGDEVVFQNHSETLGNYGLFRNPGEMILVNALTVYKLQQGDKISLSDIRKFTQNSFQNNNGFLFPLIDHPFWNEMLYRYSKHFPEYGLPFLNLPFLNNSITSFNIYEFIRNWSLFNIGDVVSAYGNIADKDLSTFNKILLCEAGLSDFINIDIDGQEFENNLTIIVAHMNLDDKQ